MATLLKVLNNLADIKSAGGVALRVRTQDRFGRKAECQFSGMQLNRQARNWNGRYAAVESRARRFTSTKNGLVHFRLFTETEDLFVTRPQSL